MTEPVQEQSLEAFLQEGGVQMDAPRDSENELLRGAGIDPVANVRLAGSMPMGVSEGGEGEMEGVQGMPQNISLSRREAFRMRNPEVDTDSGLRMYSDRLSIMTSKGENQAKHLDSMFGVGGWREDDGRIIIRNPETGEEKLVDEIGISLGDFVDMADTGIELGGAAVGGAVGGLLKAGHKTILALEALGAGGAGAWWDIENTYGEVDAKRAAEIGKEFGEQAMLDYLAGYGTLKLAKLAKPRVGDKETVGSINQSLERLNKVKNKDGKTINVPSTVAQRTGSPAATRIEAIGAKVPFVDATFMGQRAEQEMGLRQVQEALVARETGDVQDLVVGLNREYDDLVYREGLAYRKADDLIRSQIDEVGEVLSKNGDELNISTSADVLRNRIENAHQRWREQTEILYNKVDELPGGDQKVVLVDGIAADVRALMEHGFPRNKLELDEAGEVVGGGDLNEFFTPQEAINALRALENLDDMTLRQARIARALINNRMNNASDAIPKRVLGDVSQQLTEAINNAKRYLPEETVDALNRANVRYSQEVDKFHSPGVSSALVRFGEKGYVDNVPFINQTLLSGDREVIKRTLGFIKDPQERGVILRGLYNKILHDSRSPSGNTTDMKQFRSRILAYPKEVTDELFGKERAKELRDILNNISYRSGDLEVDFEKLVRGDVKRAVREAAALGARRTQEFENQIIKPFLKDGSGDLTMIAEELPGHIFNNGFSRESRLKAIKRFKGIPEAENALRKGTLEQIFSRSTGSATSRDAVPGLIAEGDNILKGSELTKAVNDFDQNGHLTELLGKETVLLLRDIAKVKSVSSDIAADTAGGLIAGGMIMKGFAAIPAISAYKLAAWALTHQPLAKLLGRMADTRRVGAIGREPLTRMNAIKSGLAGQILLDAQREFRDEPGAVSIVQEFLRDNLGIDVGQPQEENTGPTQSLEEFLGPELSEVNEDGN